MLNFNPEVNENVHPSKDSTACPVWSTVSGGPFTVTLVLPLSRPFNGYCCFLPFLALFV